MTATIAKLVTTALLCVTLLACGAKEEPTGVIPEGHQKALEKAKDVENLLEDSKVDRMKAVDGDSDQ